MTKSHPFEINRLIQNFGIRYTFWHLTEVCGFSVSRAFYLIFLSI